MESLDKQVWVCKVEGAFATTRTSVTDGADAPVPQPPKAFDDRAWRLCGVIKEARACIDEKRTMTLPGGGKMCMPFTAHDYTCFWQLDGVA